MIYVGPKQDEATDSEHPPISTLRQPGKISNTNLCGATVISSPAKEHKYHSIKKSPKKSKKVVAENHPRQEEHFVGEASGSPRKQCSVRSKQLPGSPRWKRVNSADLAHSNADSDEQWIDGPRFHKSKVLEGQKIKQCELETWIDGPEATYGYMDEMKKCMIRKWVHSQNSPTKKNRHSTSFSESCDCEVENCKKADRPSKHKDKYRDKRRSYDNSKEYHIDQSPKPSPSRRKSISNTDRNNFEENQTIENKNIDGTGKILSNPENDNISAEKFPPTVTSCLPTSEPNPEFEELPVVNDNLNISESIFFF